MKLDKTPEELIDAWIAKLEDPDSKQAKGKLPEAPTMDTMDAIILIETGNPDPDEYAAAFQRLIDTGIVWTLQGWYGRSAVELARSGRVVLTTEP